MIKFFEFIYTYNIFNNTYILQLLYQFKRYKTISIKESFSNCDIYKLNIYI